MAIKEAGWRQSQTETDARLEDTVGGKTFLFVGWVLEHSKPRNQL